MTFNAPVSARPTINGPHQLSANKEKDIKISDTCPEETLQKTDEVPDDDQDPCRQFKDKMDANANAVYEMFRKTCLEGETKLKDKTTEADNLRSKLISLKKLHKKEKKTLNARLAVKASRVKELKAYAKELGVKAARGPTSQPLSEPSMIHCFYGLQGQIEHITSSIDLRRTYHGVNSIFHKRYNESDGTARLLLLREKIYKIIHDCILGEDDFDIVWSFFHLDHWAGNSAYAAKNSESKIQNGLEDPECHLGEEEDQ
ncbi:hypothetical protein E4U53_006053 [Claviceps sorghi]|nr:hypothetical protein E4U53_006053 [Claviceps sorghi]